MKQILLIILLNFFYLNLIAQDDRLPIIDMHLHALPATSFGSPPTMACKGTINFLPVQAEEGLTGQFYECETTIWSPETDEEILIKSINILGNYNMFGVTSGPIELVRKWKSASPDRIIPAILLNAQGPSSEIIKELINNDEIEVIGEITTQLDGLSPNDLYLEQYWSMAEELGIPVGIHIGLCFPGSVYIGIKNYRASLSDPLLLEDVLINHPKLRIYIMHSGWPMLNSMIHLLHSYPQIYCDIGFISWVLPRKEFHRYLKTIVEAGFGKRVMFGSDQIIWPETIEIAIDAIESAEFLSFEQKRDVFYNNAARFLQLSEEEIKNHHEMTTR